MADMSKFSPDNGLTVLNVKDAVARSGKVDKSDFVYCEDGDTALHSYLAHDFFYRNGVWCQTSTDVEVGDTWIPDGEENSNYYESNIKIQNYLNLKLDMSGVATPQYTDTASKNFRIGDIISISHSLGQNYAPIMWKVVEPIRKNSLLNPSRNITPVTIQDLLEALAEAQSALIKDTVGWIGKNFNKGEPGFTFVKSSAPSHTFAYAKPIISGNKYIISMNISNVSGYSDGYALRVGLTSDDYEWSIPISSTGRIYHEFTASETVENGAMHIFIPSDEANAATVTISDLMITDVDVSTDITYEPYHESVNEYFASKELLKNTVGWTGKNLLNDEIIGSIAVEPSTGNFAISSRPNGLCYVAKIENNTDYTISKKSGTRFRVVAFVENPINSTEQSPIAGTDIVNQNNLSEYTFNSGNYNYLCFNVNANGDYNLADIKAQLEKGSTATSYEPYHASVEETLRDAEVVEGKNLLPTNGYKATTGDNVTFTYNSDGSVTATGSVGSTLAEFYVPIPSELNGDFYFSGCPTGGSNSTFDVYAWDNTAGGRPKKWDGTTNSASDFGNTSQECKLIAGHTSSIRIRIRVNQSNINATFKLMLRKPTEDDIYEPYYTPLKDVVPTKADNSVIAPVENNSTALNDYAVGDYFIKDTILGKTKAAIASGGTFTKDTNYEETNVAKELTELYKYIGILTTPVEAFTANSLPMLKRNITNAFYNGSLRAEIAAGNFKNVRPGDYIIGQATGSTYYVAECDYWLGNGDSTNGTTYPAYNTHHLGLMLFKPVGTTALWKGYGYSDKSWRVSASDLGRCPWNAATDVDPTDTEAIGSNSTNITRSYNGTNMSAYMGSFIRERIDAILLPQCFQADFGSANVLKRRNWLSNAINTEKISGGRGDWTGIASGSVWVDRFIDLPSEVELYGSRINSSSRDDVGVQNKQLPIFKNGRIHDFYPRIDLWTKGVASATSVASRRNHGYADTHGASIAYWACPLGCVK